MHCVLKVFAGANKMSISPLFFLQRWRCKYCKRIRQNHPNAKTSNFTAALTIETQRTYAKSHLLQFSRIERHFVGKGRPGPNPHCNFISVFWGSKFRSRGLRFVDINPRRCPAAFRENWKRPFEVVGCWRRLCDVDFYLHIYICHFTLAYAW